jgi:hypothetical protein
LSLEQRCADIKNKMKIGISVKTLTKIYDLHRVRVKKVMTKNPETKPHLMEKRLKEMRALKYSLEYVAEKVIPLYYLDEATFTAKGYCKQAWSGPGKNILVDFQRAPKAVSCSIIIDETGLHRINMKTGAFVKEDHWAFLTDFRKQLGHDDPVAIYSDGLSFHHSKATKELMAHLRIIGVQAIGYSAPLHCSEQVWRVQKKLYRFKLLEFITMHPASELNLYKLVEDLMSGPIDLDFEKVVKQKHKELVKRVGAKLH